ncbi:MAG: hypothetical protein H0X63_06040 [Flavobacteriales bacterium]|nr:hypothetical protein [Flavobacteriales bacterium]
MIKTITSPRFLFVGTLILMAAVSRLLPHPDNFTPIAAMALFGGAHLSRRYAMLLPILALLISDIFLGFHSSIWAVYLSMAIIAGIGMLIAKNQNIATVFGATLIGSILFFLITNFAVWFGTPYYPQNAAGLIACYEAGIPFFRNTMLGDLCYSGILFGSYYFAKQKFPQLAA